MHASDRAWLALGAGVLAWDLLAPPNQTLSEGADRYMEKHPWVTRGVGVALVAHVCNMVDEKVDPIHWLFVLFRGSRAAVEDSIQG